MGKSIISPPFGYDIPSIPSHPPDIVVITDDDVTIVPDDVIVVGIPSEELIDMKQLSFSVNETDTYGCSICKLNTGDQIDLVSVLTVLYAAFRAGSGAVLSPGKIGIDLITQGVSSIMSTILGVVMSVGQSIVVGVSLAMFTSMPSQQDLAKLIVDVSLSFENDSQGEFDPNDVNYNDEVDHSHHYGTLGSENTDEDEVNDMALIDLGGSESGSHVDPIVHIVVDETYGVQVMGSDESGSNYGLEVNGINTGMTETEYEAQFVTTTPVATQHVQNAKGWFITGTYPVGQPFYLVPPAGGPKRAYRIETYTKEDNQPKSFRNWQRIALNNGWLPPQNKGKKKKKGGSRRR